MLSKEVEYAVEGLIAMGVLKEQALIRLAAIFRVLESVQPAGQTGYFSKLKASDTSDSPEEEEQDEPETAPESSRGDDIDEGKVVAAGTEKQEEPVCKAPKVARRNGNGHGVAHVPVHNSKRPTASRSSSVVAHEVEPEDESQDDGSDGFESQVPVSEPNRRSALATFQGSEHQEALSIPLCQSSRVGAPA